MNLTFVTKGYVEVYLNGQFVSRHTLESKAIESAMRAPGAYEIHYPVKVLTWTNDQPDSGEWYPRPGEINGDLTLA